jgi:hypothetical protein
MGKAALRLRWSPSSGGVLWGSERAGFCFFEAACFRSGLARFFTIRLFCLFEAACFRSGLTRFFTVRLLAAGQLRVRQNVRKSRANTAAALGTPDSVWRGTAEAADALNMMLWQITKDPERIRWDEKASLPNAVP